MAPRIQRPPPPYQQVAQNLRDQIKNGILQPGDVIPSERDLAQRWQISRATATKAVAALRSQGLVESIVGVGTRVSSPAAPAAISRSSRDRRHLRPSGEKVEITTSRMSPPDDVRVALKLGPNDEAIARSRTTSVDGRPVELSTSWFDGAIADDCPKLLDPAPIDGGTTAYIAQQLGYQAISALDDVAAEMVTSEQAEQFGGAEQATKNTTGKPAAILVTRTTVLDETAGPFAFEIHRHLSYHRAIYSYAWRPVALRADGHGGGSE